MIQTTHNGVKYVYIPGGGRYVEFRGMGLCWVKDKEQPAGVIIEKNGVRIFRPNEFYEHVVPLDPATKPQYREKYDGRLGKFVNY